MAVIANDPTSYFHANPSGVYENIVTKGGKFSCPDDPVNNSGGPTSEFTGQTLFALWMTDIIGDDKYKQLIFIVNNTGALLHMAVTPYYDGGTLVSQPVSPDGKTANLIPAGYTTDRGTYLGMGRFVRDYGSLFHGSGIGLILNTVIYGVSQNFGIFVAGSMSQGAGLDVCANMDGVDPKTRFDSVAGQQKTPLCTLRDDKSGALRVRAVLLGRGGQPDIAPAQPPVFVYIT